MKSTYLSAAFRRLYQSINSWWKEKVAAYHFLFDRNGDTIRFGRKLFASDADDDQICNFLAAIAGLGRGAAGLVPEIRAYFENPAVSDKRRSQAAATLLAIAPRAQQLRLLAMLTDPASGRLGIIVAEGVGSYQSLARGRKTLPRLILPLPIVAAMIDRSEGEILKLGFLQLSVRLKTDDSVEDLAAKYLQKIFSLDQTEPQIAALHAMAGQKWETERCLDTEPMRKFLPLILAGLGRQTDGKVICEYLAAVRRIGCREPGLLKVFRSYIMIQHQMAAVEAIEAVAEYEAAAGEALTELTLAALGGDRSVRAAAVKALERIGAAAPPLPEEGNTDGQSMALVVNVQSLAATLLSRILPVNPRTA